MKNLGILFIMSIFIILPYEGNSKYVQTCLVKYKHEYLGWSGFFENQVTFYTSYEFSNDWFINSVIKINKSDTYAVIDWSQNEKVVVRCNNNLCGYDICDYDDFKRPFSNESTYCKDEKGNEFFICINKQKFFCNMK